MGMFLLLGTAFFSRTQFVQKSINSSKLSNQPINRSRTWYSFCISWIISCLSYCLLFFAMEQFNPNEKPTYGLCLVQAALMAFKPHISTGATTFALLLDVWWMFRAATLGKRSGGERMMNLFLLVPYVLWVLPTVGVPHCWCSRATSSTSRSVHRPLLCLEQSCASYLGLLSDPCLLLGGYSHVKRRMQANRNSSHPSRAFVLPQSDGDTRKGKSTHGKNKEQILALIIRLISVRTERVFVITVFNRAVGPRADLALAALPPTGVVVFGSQTLTLIDQQEMHIYSTSLFFISLLTGLPPFVVPPHSTFPPVFVVYPGKNLHDEEQGKQRVVIEMEIGSDLGDGNASLRDAEQAMISSRRAIIFRENDSAGR
ncbi:hypothetical protein J3R30DRAFT_3739396 [Lentinula aciculospora]|uniref:Uncharacterized protein n=1 Tax=Lentinula aciculospora TaxID=153920 RepID=A0A9W8ZWQ2_9AGAR|nr:hypothetical protein J3R30DRAFT_3739396 [Lentinula aciculospora]